MLRYFIFLKKIKVKFLNSTQNFIFPKKLRILFSSILIFSLLAFVFNNCSPAFKASLNSNVSTSNELGPQNPAISEGAKLYTTNCSTCHNELNYSTKLSPTPRTADQILNAINTLSYMKTANLKSLTKAEIQSIADALRETAINNSPPPAQPVSNQPCVETAIPRRLWLLSRLEYDNTIRVVLKDTSDLAKSTFPAEYKANGFSINEMPYSIDASFLNVIMTTATNLAKNNASKELSALGCTPSTSPGGTTQDSCILNYIKTKGKLFFRRPLIQAEINDLYDSYLVGFQNPESGDTASLSGVRSLLVAFMISPGFLYRTELGDLADTTSTTLNLTQYEVASALSYQLTASPPDAALMAKADSNQLGSAAAIGAEVDRLLATDAAKGQVAKFVMEMAGSDQIEKFSNSSTGLSQALVSSMAKETANFVQFVTYSGSGTVKELFNANYSFLDGLLSTHYGIALPSGSSTAAFNKVDVSPKFGTGGLLSHASFTVSNSQFHVPLLSRAKVVRQTLLCQNLPSLESLGIESGFTPPTLQAPQVGQTTRDVLMSAVPVGTSCYQCHQFLNSIGFALENFSRLGQFRTTENGVNINASDKLILANYVDVVTGQITAVQDVRSIGFSNYTEFANVLSNSDDLSKCFARKAWVYSSASSNLTANECSINKAQSDFVAGGSKILSGFGAYFKSTRFIQRKR